MECVPEKRRDLLDGIPGLGYADLLHQQPNVTFVSELTKKQVDLLCDELQALPYREYRPTVVYMVPEPGRTNIVESRLTFALLPVATINQKVIPAPPAGIGRGDTGRFPV